MCYYIDIKGVNIMNKNSKLFDYFLLFLSILSISYFLLLIFSSRFITAYCAYPIFSLITAFYGCYELKTKISLLSKLPVILRYLVKGLGVIGIILFIIIEGLIIYNAGNKYDNASDYIIVLGARLNNDTPSNLLRYRLDATLKLHQQFPNTVIIVSGGRGQGETVSEAQAMKDYLVNRGVDESLVIEEDKSTNTNENIIFSKKIIDSLTKDNYSATIITNRFHCYRSKLLADKHNLPAHTYSAKENQNTAPHYYIREFFGCLKDMLLS